MVEPVLDAGAAERRRPVKLMFPPDADVPNPMGLSTAEINDGLEMIKERGRAKRAEEAARNQSAPPS